MSLFPKQISSFDPIKNRLFHANYKIEQQLIIYFWKCATVSVNALVPWFVSRIPLNCTSNCSSAWCLPNVITHFIIHVQQSLPLSYHIDSYQYHIDYIISANHSNVTSLMLTIDPPDKSYSCRICFICTIDHLFANYCSIILHTTNNYHQLVIQT